MQSPTLRIAVLVALGSVTACASSTATRQTPRVAQETPPIVQPGAPGKPGQVISAAAAADQSKVQHVAADVTFMQGMIHHHAQAVDMTDLLFERSANPDMKKLAQRIQLSQVDEIKMMRRWLEDRGEDAPGEHAHHMPGAPMMPGMLTPAEMEQLAAAKGPEFDRLFLQGMIKHHGGALTMVQELFATPGAAQESVMFAFASDVDADQRAEIDRMGAMLAAMKERK